MTTIKIMTSSLQATKLTKKQAKQYTAYYSENGQEYRMTATVRHDDSCGNGHNSFAITCDIREKRGDYYYEYMGGCCHEEIAKHIPELAPYIKWHLTSTDGPMHYVANTIYHAKKISKHQQQQFVYLENKQLGIRPTLLGIFSDDELPAIKKAHGAQFIKTKEHFNGMAKEADVDAARRSSIWPDATLEQLLDEGALNARLPSLLSEFQSDVEALGMVY